MHLAARYEVTDAKQVRTAPVSVLTSPRLGYDCVFISSIGMQVAGGERMGKFRIFFNCLWLSVYPDHHETYYRADRSKCKNCIRTHVLFVVQNTKFTPSVRNCAQRKAEIGRAWGEVVVGW
jgi:hypothetical protein